MFVYQFENLSRRVLETVVVWLNHAATSDTLVIILIEKL